MTSERLEDLSPSEASRWIDRASSEELESEEARLSKLASVILGQKKLARIRKSLDQVRHEIGCRKVRSNW